MRLSQWLSTRSHSCSWWVWLRSSLPRREWLFPNFSRHWGNWLLAPLLAFMLGFLSTSAFAADQYWTCSSWQASCGNQYPSATPEEVCQKRFGSYDFFITRPYDRYGCGQYVDGTTTVIASIETWPNGCSAALKETQGHPCYEPANQCPESGTAGGLEVTLYHGQIPPEYYTVDGCQFVVVEYECQETNTATQLRQCFIDGDYTGETSSVGPGNWDPNDPGDKPQRRCYRPDGSTTELIDFDAPCPEGSSDEPPDPDQCDVEADPDCEGNGGECDPNDPDCTDGGDGGDGDEGECDPETETCPNDGADCDPEKEECPNGEGVEGGKECDPEKPPVCTGPPLTCYQIKQTWKDQCGLDETATGAGTEECDKEFVCKGSPIDCAALRIERENYCNSVAFYNVDNMDDAVAAELNKHGFGSNDFNEDGTLADIHEVIDISDDLSLVPENGGSRSGSCPGNVPLRYGEFSYGPMCDVATSLRPLILFAAAFHIYFMYSSGLFGARKS